MKFSTGVPNCREGRLNPIGSVDRAWMSEVAQAAEQFGYYSLWLNEFMETEPNVRLRFDAPPNYHDALTTIGYLAALTRRIRFVPSVIVLPLHHPILLNRQVATLDVLSGGRMTLGVGLGGSHEDYRRLRGELGAVNRGQMMDEIIEALRALWTEEKASFSGRFVNFRDVHCFRSRCRTRCRCSWRARRMPFCGASDASARAESTPSPRPTACIEDRPIRGYAREARGADAPIEIARQFYISLADTREAAQANRAASLPNAKPTPPSRRGPDAEAMLIGTPEQIAARLRDYAAIGSRKSARSFIRPTSPARCADGIVRPRCDPGRGLADGDSGRAKRLGVRRSSAFGRTTKPLARSQCRTISVARPALRCRLPTARHGRRHSAGWRAHGADSVDGCGTLPPPRQDGSAVRVRAAAASRLTNRWRVPPPCCRFRPIATPTWTSLERWCRFAECSRLPIRPRVGCTAPSDERMGWPGGQQNAPHSSLSAWIRPNRSRPAGSWTARLPRRRAVRTRSGSLAALVFARWHHGGGRSWPATVPFHRCATRRLHSTSPRCRRPSWRLPIAPARRLPARAGRRGLSDRPCLYRHAAARSPRQARHLLHPTGPHGSPDRPGDRGVCRLDDGPRARPGLRRWRISDTRRAANHRGAARLHPPHPDPQYRRSPSGI